MKRFLLPILMVFTAGVFLARWVWAAECSPTCGGIEECQQKIDECTKLLQVSVAATKPHEQKMAELQRDIDAIESNIDQLTKQIALKQAGIARDEGKLAERQKALDAQIRDFYKKDWQSGLEYMLVTLFSSDNVGEALSQLAYRQNLIDREKKTITSLVLEITDLAEAKKKLEGTQDWLAAKKADLEVTLAPVRKLVNEAKAYQSQLSATVGSLSARQQQLIAEKIGSLGLSRSAGISMACSDDRNVDPGFSPRFDFPTFGLPHRVGMSQFGAYGRANSGQNYHDILSAYFASISFDHRSNINISVDGYGSMPLEQYLLGIYEVPDGWPMEALKAQVVAARSYALAYTNNGANSICTTQDCQVYKGGNKGGNWEQAVKQTEGEVMASGGQVIKAWFSSTDGGYTHSSADVFGGATAWTKNFRDTTGDIGSASDLFSKAYDRDSPCFYNAQGWRREYNKTAWLKSDEVADIVNVIMVSAYTNDWDSWSADQVKDKLRANGVAPFNSVSSVSMSFDWGYGRTTSVSVSGDAGSKTFDGKTFKDYFNVRAPANIAIVGPLYNIEKR